MTVGTSACKMSDRGTHTRLPGSVSCCCKLVDAAQYASVPFNSVCCVVMINPAASPLTKTRIEQEFNRGIIDYLIATDDPKTVEQEKGGSPPMVDEKKGRGNGKKRKRAETDGEYGVTRGVDFKGVATVINVDAPPSVTG